MTQAQLTEAIESQYDNGRYSGMGADGGVLKYIMVNIDGQWYSASITLDYEIAKIRRVWAINKLNKNYAKTDTVFDLTDEYYKARGL